MFLLSTVSRFDSRYDRKSDQSGIHLIKNHNYFRTQNEIKLNQN